MLKVVYSYRVGHFCQLEQIFNLLTTNMFCVRGDFALQCQSAFGSLLPDPDNDTGNANARPTQDQLSDPRSEIKHVTRTPRCDHFPTKWNLALIENMLHADSEKLGLLDLICGINEHVTKVFLSFLSDQCGTDEHASGKNIPSARYPDFHNKNTNLSQIRILIYTYYVGQGDCFVFISKTSSLNGCTPTKYGTLNILRVSGSLAA